MPVRKSTFKIRSAIEQVIAAIVLFYGALAFCLPVAYSKDIALVYPWWANRIGIGNILLHELIFLIWFALFGSRFVLRRLLNSGFPTRQAALWLLSLALWCGLISLTTPLPLQDLGRTFRLFLNVALIFATVRWTLKMGNFPLTVFILGFLIGAIINLVISFQYPLVVNGVMRLSGQNTPGVYMGIGIHLSAWLFYQSNSRKNQALSVITAMVCAYGCGLSYSRIGWFVGALGFMVWIYILIVGRLPKVIDRLLLRKKRRVWVPLLTLGILALWLSHSGQENLRNIKTLLVQKLISEDRDKSGDSYRLAYFIGVAEIITINPWGVGYSGFFDAMRATEIYKSGKASPEEGYDANPHSAFLYYTSAGGIPGAIMTITAFILLLNSMRFGLVTAKGRAGRVMFLCAAPSFVLIGLTVPYIFNSVILIVPTAIAAGWGWEKHFHALQQ